MTIAEIYPLLKSLWTVWFSLMFVGIVWWAMRPHNRERFEADSRIPMRDDA